MDTNKHESGIGGRRLRRINVAGPNGFATTFRLEMLKRSKARAPFLFAFIGVHSWFKIPQSKVFNPCTTLVRATEMAGAIAATIPRIDATRKAVPMIFGVTSK